MEIPKDIFTKKTSGFLALGIMLYLGSVYMNTIRDHIADLGADFGLSIIVVAVVSQIANWIKYWKK